jgi:predicted ATPase
MIRSLYIQNFKCFDRLSLKMAPLTLLTGFNAAGKSTTIQSLLLLAQTMRSLSIEPQLLLNGPLVSLGSPGEVLNQQNSSKEIQLGFSTEQANALWRYTVSGDSARRSLTAESCEVTGVKGGAFHSVEELIYLGATRQGDKHLFPVTEDSAISGDCGCAGQFAPWNFYRFGDDPADPKRSTSSEPGTIRKEINAWLNVLFPGAEANVIPIVGTEFALLQFRTSATGEWQRPSNVGFGLSYAFPFLVSGMCSRPGQSIIVDSPEAHLHPKGQSQIGRFAARLAGAGQQLIIETHSDHFLNGVRLALREGLLTPEDVALYFFSHEDGLRNVQELSVDSKGNINDWPVWFVDQAEQDLAVLAGWI